MEYFDPQFRKRLLVEAGITVFRISIGIDQDKISIINFSEICLS